MPVAKALAILDFDSLVSLPKNQSIAFACDRFSRNINDMAEFIQSYRKTDDSLIEEDVKKFPDLVIREALSRIHYLLRLHFFQSKDVWNFEFDRHVNIILRMNCIKEEFANVH